MIQSVSVSGSNLRFIVSSLLCFERLSVFLCIFFVTQGNHFLVCIAPLFFTQCYFFPGSSLAMLSCQRQVFAYSFLAMRDSVQRFFSLFAFRYSAIHSLWVSRHLLQRSETLSLFFSLYSFEYAAKRALFFFLYSLSYSAFFCPWSPLCTLYCVLIFLPYSIHSVLYCAC